jgi:large subunit ribosomal protein L13
MMKTYVAKPETMQRKWYVIDAAGMPIGRMAVEAAKILRGKNKPEFTPNEDAGDFVIVINAEKSVLTGKNKPAERLYRHSGYPGGIKSISRGQLLEEQPVKMVMKVIKGMLPHNKLGDAMFRKLKVNVGPDHGHEAQQPVVLKFD